MMKCPNCENQEMALKTIDIQHSYRGESIIIKNVTSEVCPSCDEMLLSHEETQRVSDAISAFNKQVNTAAIDPECIRGVRKKLSLDQKEAGEIFGGGVNAFSRYENGKIMPLVALIKLLRILDTHPDLLSMVR